MRSAASALDKKKERPFGSSKMQEGGASWLVLVKSLTSDHRMRSYKKKSKRRMKKGEELLLRMDPMEGRGKEGKTQARKRYYGCKVCNDLRGC